MVQAAPLPARNLALVFLIVNDSSDSKETIFYSWFSFSSTNGFQENHTFSFANVLPHGVCSAVYHPQHSLLIIGSLIGQCQKNSTGEYKKKQSWQVDTVCKTGCSSGKSNRTFRSTGDVFKKRSQRHFSFLIFTGKVGKSLHHFLWSNYCHALVIKYTAILLGNEMVNCTVPFGRKLLPSFYTKNIRIQSLLLIWLVCSSQI